MNEALAKEVLRQNAEIRQLRADLDTALRGLTSVRRKWGVKTDALKAARKRIRALNLEIRNT